VQFRDRKNLPGMRKIWAGNPLCFFLRRHMKSESQSNQLHFLAHRFREMCNPKNPLWQLAEKIDWTKIETKLSPLYAGSGRPAKPIRLMGLNLLMHMFKLGDETVIRAWVENLYYQYFTGESVFQWTPPVASSDMVYFRKRIGTEGLERILVATIQVHVESAKEEEVIVDTIVRMKNTTHPTDVKLFTRIEHCWRIAGKEEIDLRQRYSRVQKKYLYLKRFRKSKVRFKEAIRAVKGLKVNVGHSLGSKALSWSLPTYCRGSWPGFRLMFTAQYGMNATCRAKQMISRTINTVFSKSVPLTLLAGTTNA
jgi:hypothetical protein